MLDEGDRLEAGRRRGELALDLDAEVADGDTSSAGDQALVSISTTAPRGMHVEVNHAAYAPAAGSARVDVYAL